MKPIPPPPGGTPRPSGRDSLGIYLPGGVPVLRAAVEELQKSGWDPIFQQRAVEISCAFEGSFRAGGHLELAAIARSLTLLVEVSPAEVTLLGSALRSKIHELLGRM